MAPHLTETSETDAIIKKQEKSSIVDSQQHDPFQVFLEDEELPQHLSMPRKWMAVVVIGSAALCVTCASSMVSGSLIGHICFLSLRHCCNPLGRLYGERRISRFSRRAHCINPLDQSVHLGVRNRSFNLWPTVGSIWTKLGLLGVLLLVFCFQLASNICTRYM